MNPFSRSFAGRSFRLYALGSGALFLLLLSCNQNPAGDGRSAPARTPREAYLAALESNGLAETEMVRAWRSAGTQALEDSVLLEAPFRETGYFRAAVPAALAYRIKLKTGELLHINLVADPDSILLFADLFRVETTDSTPIFRPVFSAENYRTNSLAYEVRQSGTYLLRIQPELLVSCRYTLQLLVQPVYGIFPVSGKGNPDIWSFFGDSRDAGRRRHEGIDIFAPRGVPVVAATDGMVSRVRDEGIGGKQVWLYDPRRGQALYYAHLDSQLVAEGRSVRAGDTIGLVGNTGNARDTRPHLHFGIYRRGYGAIDPHPFVALQADKAPAVNADVARLGQLARVRLPNTRLQAAPHPRSLTLAVLNEHLPLEVIAASKFWYRVRSPDGLSGYLPANSLEDIDRSISKTTLAEATELLQSPHPEATPVSAVRTREEVAVIGKNGRYQLVVDKGGVMGWVPLPAR